MIRWKLLSVWAWSFTINQKFLWRKISIRNHSSDWVFSLHYYRYYLFSPIINLVIILILISSLNFPKQYFHAGVSTAGTTISTCVKPILPCGFCGGRTSSVYALNGLVSAGGTWMAVSCQETSEVGSRCTDFPSLSLQCENVRKKLGLEDWIFHICFRT